MKFMAQDNPFQKSETNITDNSLLRTPQREAYSALAEYDEEGREVGIILPVGCGKSGCITLAPFAFGATRTLVVAPNLKIAEQLFADFDPAKPNMFYQKCKVLSGAPYPEPVEIRGQTTNHTDLEVADVVITNIQQLQGVKNHWLQKLASNFFDLILFDEGHHSVAASWTTLKAKFPDAQIVNFSATPLRADGQLMSGKVIYSFPIFQAIKDGYVKRLKALVLNPKTLRYVRNDGGQEVEVGLDEVRRLGEVDAGFRRSIVTSDESLTTIVDASIRELMKLRKAAENDRLKIIASALNYDHCHQIVSAYRKRGQRVDFVHSREDAKANTDVIQKLEAHELDVIVQVRKLGEGFDHPFLSVAAVFSVFTNLSPFVQFVGRIMRVIKQDAPGHPLNYGTVVFHAGANIASRWEDFQEYSEADKDFLDQLLPMEGLDFSSVDELKFEPHPRECDGVNGFNIEGQTDVELQELPLIKDNPAALAALEVLRAEGYSSDQVRQEYERLEPVPVTKVRQRQAMRENIDQRVKTAVGRILGGRGINPEGYELDRKYLGRTNFVVLKSAIDKNINRSIGESERRRDQFKQTDLDQITANFDDIVVQTEKEVFRG